MLSLDPALKMQSEGPASHLEAISEQREDWRQQFGIFRSAGIVSPMLCSSKDTDALYVIKNTGMVVCYSCVGLLHGKKGVPHGWQGMHIDNR